MTETLEYAICPSCWRAVPKQTGEQFCSNDGTLLLNACPHCQAPITSPYARYCTRCGQSLIKQPYIKQSHIKQSHEEET